MAVAIGVGSGLLGPGAAAAEEAEEPSETSGEEAPLRVTVRGKEASPLSGRGVDAEPGAPLDAAELVESLPSVHVRRLGAEGSPASISVRGSASSQVGVYLGGIPLSSAGDPVVDVASLPLWPGAGLRVFRGFAPASLGTTGHLGGVLAVELPDPLTGERTETLLAAGSFGSRTLRAADLRRVPLGAGRALRLGTAVFASRSDGDFSYEAPDPADPEGRTPRTFLRRNAGHARAGGLARVSLETRGGTVGLVTLADARRQGAPGPASRPTLSTRLETDRLVLGIDGRRRTGPGAAAHGLAWIRRETSSFFDPRGELDLAGRPGESKQAIVAAGGSLGHRSRLGARGRYDLFVDGRLERFEAARRFESEGESEGPSASRLGLGLALDARLRAGERLVLSASGRLDARRDRARDLSVSSLPGTSSLEAGQVLVPTFHLGAAYALGEAATLSARAGAVSRPPSFVELFGNGGTLLGNPALPAERALSADLALAGEAGARRAGFALAYEIGAFATSARDLVAFVEAGRGTFRATNVAAARILGLEVAARLTAGPAAHQLSYALADPTNAGDDPRTRGRPLPGRPAHDLSYEARYRARPFGLRYRLDAIAGSTVDTVGAIALPPRILHGLGASFEPRRLGVVFALDLRNALDLRTLHVPASSTPGAARPPSTPVPVSDFLGFPLADRAIYLTVRYRSGAPAE